VLYYIICFGDSASEGAKDGKVGFYL